MNWQDMILWFVALIISLTFHEAAHAFFAKLGGDLTAYNSGQVTLNPLPHMQREPFGMVVLPILSLLMSNGKMCFGYAHAPIDPLWAYRNPKKAALMSAAGPMSNLLLAGVAFAVLWYIGRPASDTQEAVRQIAGTFLMLNILLAVFNVLPVPPLDGAGVVQGLVPASRGLYDALNRIPYIGLVIFIGLIKVIPYLFWPVFLFVNRLLPWQFFPK